MNKYLTIILVFAFLFSCENEENVIEPISLSENVEIYERDLISNDYIFVVENSSTYSYLINKEGYKIYEWNFEAFLYDLNEADVVIWLDGNAAAPLSMPESGQEALLMFTDS